MWHKAWLRSLLRRFQPRSTGRLRGKRNTAALYRIEALEPRVLLSAIGPETLVDDNNAATIPHGAIAMDGAGNYVITWIENVPGQTVYAQRYNSAGVPQGDRIVVSPNRSPQLPGMDVFPSDAQVAMDSNGNFIVTFMANDTTNSIYAQRYNNLGQPQGSLIHINSDNVGDGDVLGRIAMDADGDFVVSWSRATGSTVDVVARRYDASGVLQGGTFIVYTSSTAVSVYSSVATDADGDFVIAWGTQASNPDSSPGAPELISEVSAQRYNASGVAQGSAIAVSTIGISPLQRPAVAMDVDGDFVVTWSGFETEGDNADVFAQRYNASGIAQGSVITVNTNPSGGTVVRSSIAMDDGGDFVITWNAEADQTDVFAQRFSATGSPQGTEISVNSTTAGVQTFASVAMDSDDDFVIVWTRDAAFPFSNVLFQRFLGDIPPVVSGIEPYPLTYPPNGPAAIITSTLTLTDQDDANLAGATIQISAGYQAGDVLTFTNTANITGVFNAGTGVLTLTGSDTVANYQAALRSVTYSSTSPDPAVRTISFQVTDGVESSNVVSRFVGGLAQLVGSTVIVHGTPQVDVIVVSEAAVLNIVVDGVSFDFVSAQVSAIEIHGSDGNDSIVVNSLFSGRTLQVFGGNGNDSINISSSVVDGVTLDGGDGNDLLLGGSGNDSLIGGIGNDWLNGRDGFDSLTGGAGSDVYDFNDTLTNEIDTVFELAGEGTDLLNFQTMTTAITADLTSDSLLATMNHRIVQAGAAGQSANVENVNGGSANDFITGNAATNVIYGNGGNDTLLGGDGYDQLIGNDGNDLLKGGHSDDILSGGAGDDYLIGDVNLLGESGNDWMDGGEGSDMHVGGSGDDTYFFTDADVNQIDTLVEGIAGGTDMLDLSAITQWTASNLASDSELATMNHRIVSVAVPGQSAYFENAAGGVNRDHITGNAANNILFGNDDNDTLIGGGGNDILLGGGGSDLLKGISGRNILIGGTGSDLLLGGTGDDILINGTTDYDTYMPAMNAVFSEWVSGNSYQTRVDHLRFEEGGSNEYWYLNLFSTTDDIDIDYMTGNAGEDWFLANSQQDTLTDQVFGEIVT